MGIKAQYKWPYTWATGVITWLIGFITPFITGRDSSCKSLGHFRFLPTVDQVWCFQPVGNMKIQRAKPACWDFSKTIKTWYCRCDWTIQESSSLIGLYPFYQPLTKNTNWGTFDLCSISQEYRTSQNYPEMFHFRIRFPLGFHSPKKKDGDILPYLAVKSATPCYFGLHQGVFSIFGGREKNHQQFLRHT